MTFVGTTAFAQKNLPPASKPDAELTKDEAVARITNFQAKIKDLQNKLATETGNIEELKKELEETKKALEECQKALLALVEATEMDIEQFRQKLGVIEGKVRQWKGYSNDKLAEMRDQVEALEDELNELRKNKIALLPEFFGKIQQLAKDIEGLKREKKIKQYTVGTWAEDRDCLWNIAGKIEIYGDPFMWPKIWQSNTDMIRNPDIIHPGQVLTVPEKAPKTQEELRAERRYWAKKRAEMEEEKEEETGEPSKGE